MTKTSDAQMQAQKRYDKKNREKRTYLAQRSTARGFIRNKATKEDLQELEQLIAGRKIINNKKREGLSMFTEKEVKELIIAENENVYFTSEKGVQAGINALDSLNSGHLENVKAKKVGFYGGTNFEFRDLEVLDGDAIYILVEA